MWLQPFCFHEWTEEQVSCCLKLGTDKQCRHSSAFEYPMMCGHPEPWLQDQLISTPSPNTVFHPGVFLEVYCLIYGVYQHKTTPNWKSRSVPRPSVWEVCFLGQVRTVLTFFITFMPRADLNAAWAPLWLNETDGAKWRSSLLLPVV